MKSPNNGAVDPVSAAVDSVLAERQPSPLEAPAAPAPVDAPRPITLPVLVCGRLRELSALATGADAAAKAAAQVAQERRSAFENEFTTVLITMGLDPGRNWSVNFANGELSEKPKPSPTPIVAMPPDGLA